MADILMVIGVFVPDLVRGLAPIGPDKGRVRHRSKVRWVYGVQESEAAGLDQYSKSRGVFIFLQPDIAYFVCSYVIIIVFYFFLNFIRLGSFLL